MHLPTLATTPVTNRRVLLRADLNVPFAPDGSISDDYRLSTIKPTLDYLLSHQATVIVATHLGKPTPGRADPALSTRKLIPWFTQHGYHVTYCPDLATAARKGQTPSKTILLLENVRFLAGEKDGSNELAAQYASLAETYVNDAFGTCHRADTSIALTPTLFAPGNRCIGLRLEQEIAALDTLKTSPKQPFVLVLGGSKLDDKVPLIAAFLSVPMPQRPRFIAIGGALALPFLKAQGLSIGKTDLQPATVAKAAAIIAQADAAGLTLLLPTDMQVITGPVGSPPAPMACGQIPPNGQCVDIGPATIAAYTAAIATAHTIFANGTMGLYEQPAYAHGTRSILQATAANHGNTIIGGGDCAAALRSYGLADAVRFVSTGGGATLAYLSSGDPLHQLPGLYALSTTK